MFPDFDKNYKLINVFNTVEVIVSKIKEFVEENELTDKERQLLLRLGKMVIQIILENEQKLELNGCSMKSGLEDNIKKPLIIFLLK